jgi:hypothetical protein
MNTEKNIKYTKQEIEEATKRLKKLKEFSELCDKYDKEEYFLLFRYEKEPLKLDVKYKDIIHYVDDPCHNCGTLGVFLKHALLPILIEIPITRVCDGYMTIKYFKKRFNEQKEDREIYFRSLGFRDTEFQRMALNGNNSIWGDFIRYKWQNQATE